MKTKLLLARRNFLLTGATLPVLSACGGDSSAPESDAVYVGVPDASSFVVSQQSSTRTSTANFYKTNSTTAIPTTFQVWDGTTQAELIFDSLGRPSVARDIGANTQTQFLYTSNNSAIAAHYDSAGMFLTGQAFWASAGRFYTGPVSSAATRVPEDVQSPQDITDMVNKKLNELRNLPTASSASRVSLLTLLPMTSARAQVSDADLRQLVLSYIGAYANSVFPALAVGFVALGLSAAPLVAALLTIATFLLLFPGVSRANALDQSRAQDLVQQYLARPYRGSLIVSGGMNVPASVQDGPCSGSLSVVGTLEVTLIPGTTASAVIDGTEFISTPCFSQVFRKSNNGATLTRSGNSLTGTSQSSFGNPWVYDLAIGTDLSTIQGTVNYPYNAPNGFNGAAVGTVTLRR